MQTFETLLTSTEESIFIITINREEKLNALNAQVIEDLDKAIDFFVAEKSLSGCIITGKGSKAFVAGADISQFKGLSQAEGKALAQRGHDVFNKIEQSPKPIIAAVNGFALGGGCELAMACHLRIASENAKFGQPEVKLGLIPGYGGTQRLVQLIGKGKALELLMTADTIEAHRACQLGLANQVVQTVELMETSKTILKKIAQQAPFAIAKVIQCVHAHFTDGIDGFNTEIEMFGECVTTEDFTEGTSAFLEKRKANFTGK
jgi:enoyl-CoA hydratase